LPDQPVAPVEPPSEELPVTDPALTRRRALALGAVGGLSLPVLAACGGGSNDGNKTADAGPGAVLTKTKDVPVGGGVIIGNQNVTVTQPVKGTFKGFSATCTHQGCLLASVASGTINCGCHGSQFSITDGSNVAGPNGEPAGSVAALPGVKLKVEGGNILTA
jgi:nitrite reductase/ring-hydroxylating ferredoxin subunit